MALKTARHDDDAPEESHAINVTPFIDVMLVLLIIFMVAAPLATVDTPVQLPASNARPQPREEQPLFVTVQRDLSLRLNAQPVNPPDLKAALDALTGGDASRRIHLRADERVGYGELMHTLNALRAAGYRSIALVGLEQPAP